MARSNFHRCLELTRKENRHKHGFTLSFNPVDAKNLNCPWKIQVLDPGIYFSRVLTCWVKIENEAMTDLPLSAIYTNVNIHSRGKAQWSTDGYAKALRYVRSAERWPVKYIGI
jgi:hypothetical protein